MCTKVSLSVAKHFYGHSICWHKAKQDDMKEIYLESLYVCHLAFCCVRLLKLLPVSGSLRALLPNLNYIYIIFPVRAEPWEGTFDAIKSPASPMQNLELFSELNDYFPGFTIIDEDNKYQSEDCLNVTVYTSNPDESANMPVRDSLRFSHLKPSKILLFSSCGKVRKS